MKNKKKNPIGQTREQEEIGRRKDAQHQRIFNTKEWEEKPIRDWDDETAKEQGHFSD